MSRLHLLLLLAAVMSCGTPAVSYFGQHPPGTSPELFAPSIVNTDSVELNAVFNDAMTELFFTRIVRGRFVIYHSEYNDGQWTSAQPIQLFADTTVMFTAADMSLTPDGQTMYFLGIYPQDSTTKATTDIYASQKVDGQWQLAIKVGDPISTDLYVEAYPVVVSDGSLYFVSNRPGGIGKQDIYRAQYLGKGKFDTPISLSPNVNTEPGSGDTYVAPDESYLISNKRHPEKPGLYVSFKKNGQWQPLIYLGEPINSEWTDFCPYMSPDGKYFFFSRRYSDPPDSGWDGVTEGEVYWVDARVLFKLKDK
jgi:hypothetical protein